MLSLVGPFSATWELVKHVGFAIAVALELDGGLSYPV